jgi:Ser/Thr protein kinase RdoA (MazF antagonist)
LCYAVKFGKKNFSINTSRGKFFVKFFDINSEKLIFKIAETEKFFKNGGFSVMPRIKTKNNHYFLKLADLIVVVYPFVNMPLIKWERQFYADMGSTLGKIHKYSYDNNRKPEIDIVDTGQYIYNAINEIDIIKNKIRKIKSSGTLKIINSLEFRASYLEQVSPSIIFLDRKILIHGDFHPGNMIYDNRNITLLDFDNCCYRSSYYELSKVIIQTCFNGNFDRNKYLRNEVFLNKYAEEFTIDKQLLSSAIDLCILEEFGSLWFEKMIIKNILDTSEIINHINKLELSLIFFLKKENRVRFIKKILEKL